MKKIFIFLAVFATALAAQAEDKVTILTNVTADRTGANVVVNLTNETEFVAFQIDLTLPAAGTWSNSAPVITERLQNASTETVDGAAANFKTVTNWSGNTLRIVGYNLGDQTISGTSGEEILSVAVSNTEAVNWGTPICSTVFVEKTDLDEPVLTALPANVLVTTNAVNWATFAPSQKVGMSTQEGVKVHYIAAASGDKTTVTSTIIDDAEVILDAGEGVLVKTDAPNTTVSFPVVTSGIASELSGNMLVGVLEPTTKPNETSYIFTKIDDVIGFYKWDTGTLAAGKCYLDLSKAGGGGLSAPLFIALADGEATGIGNLQTEQSTSDSGIYNLSGQKVSPNYKGLVIKNGKKVTTK